MSGYRVFANNNLRDRGGACGYYRLILPLSQMEKLGLPVQIIVDTPDQFTPPAIQASLFMESDITLSYQYMSNVQLDMVRQTKKFKAMKDETNELRWPPTHIVDTDDNLFRVMPLNPAYSDLGTRRWDGSLCESGDSISIEHPLELAPPEVESILNDLEPHPLPGARQNAGNARWQFNADGKWHLLVPLWRDGENVDFAKNQAKMEAWKGLIKESNLVTCSTPELEKALKAECGDEINTYVSYNAVDFEAYPELDMNFDGNKVKILWEGSACHHEGLWPLNGVLERVAKKYPHAEFLFFGAPYKWAMAGLGSQAKHIPWVHFELYKFKLSTIGHDIAIAPLADDPFNNCRSGIRWYENSALWKPAVTLAQNTGPFKEIQEGETGMLFDTPEQFETKLCTLIEGATLRRTLASNAKDWIRTHREAGDIATKLFMKWVEVREGHKRTIPIGDSLTDEPEPPID